MAHIRIVYGTTGGNTQLVCQKVTAELEGAGHTVTLERCELAEPESLTDGDALILASPTYGHGLLEMHFEQFFPQIQHLQFDNKPVAVIALGDPKYDLDYFLESEKILTQYFETHGGQIIVEPLKIAKTPLPYLEKKVVKWCEKLTQALAENKLTSVRDDEITGSQNKK